MVYTYKTRGTCSQEIRVELENDNDTVKSLQVIGGCNGNLKGITALIRGMKVDDVIQKLGGIRCGSKPTSCPDQISKALIEARQRAKKTVSV